MNNDLKSYGGNLKSFLDKFMKNHRNIGQKEIETFRSQFTSALKNCKIIFNGENELFTNLTGERRRQGLVYFDLQMITLSEFSENDLKHHRKEIRAAWREMCSSREFKKLTEGGVQRKSSVGTRNRLWTVRLKGIVSS